MTVRLPLSPAWRKQNNHVADLRGLHRGRRSLEMDGSTGQLVGKARCLGRTSAPSTKAPARLARHSPRRASRPHLGHLRAKRAPLAAAPIAQRYFLRLRRSAGVAARPFRPCSRARGPTLPTRCKPRRQRSARTTPPIRAIPIEAHGPLSTSATHTRYEDNVNFRIGFQAAGERQLCGNLCSLIRQASKAQEAAT
jgi:hypothetical protein